MKSKVQKQTKKDLVNQNKKLLSKPKASRKSSEPKSLYEAFHQLEKAEAKKKSEKQKAKMPPKKGSKALKTTKYSVDDDSREAIKERQEIFKKNEKEIIAILNSVKPLKKTSKTSTKGLRGFADGAKYSVDDDSREAIKERQEIFKKNEKEIIAILNSVKPLKKTSKSPTKGLRGFADGAKYSVDDDSREAIKERQEIFKKNEKAIIAHLNSKTPTKKPRRFGPSLERSHEKYAKKQKQLTSKENAKHSRELIAFEQSKSNKYTLSCTLPAGEYYIGDVKDILKKDVYSKIVQDHYALQDGKYTIENKVRKGIVAFAKTTDDSIVSSGFLGIVSKSLSSERRSMYHRFIDSDSDIKFKVDNHGNFRFKWDDDSIYIPTDDRSHHDQRPRR